MIYEGKVWKVGNDIDTDVILPARYLTSTDERVLAEHCLEDVIPEFAKRVRQWDVLVAGRNFGCGSSREHAPRVLKAAGLSVVIAESFARIFFRNSFNIGLPAIGSTEAAEKIEAGDQLRVDPGEGLIHNLTRDEQYACQPIAGFMLELISCGGLVNLLKGGGWR